MNGVVVVDKPGGMTSHDVVARVRRLLGTRRVGHAGTLDPMATGVLLLLIGEGTKLGPYLTSHAKRYRARVAFGRATDTLDAEGRTTSALDPPPWLLEELRQGGGERLRAALDAERAREEQVPPAYSAIQVDGERSYDRARAGEVVELAPRPVAVREMVVTAAEPAERGPWIDLEIDVSKGYYVRSLARDLGERLGVPAHLAALRRLASGPFGIAHATPLDAGRDALVTAIVPLGAAAVLALPRAVLTVEGALRARQGKRLGPADFVELPEGAETAAWLDTDGRLVAIGAPAEARSATKNEVNGPEFVVARGFAA